jgi:carbon starvation protein
VADQEPKQEQGVKLQRRRSPWLALVTLLPLVWLLAVTFTAGAEKIFHPDPRIGFLAAARNSGWSALAAEHQLAEIDVSLGKPGAQERVNSIEKAMAKQRALSFNNLLDAAVAGIFLVLVAAIVVLSAREWLLLLGRRKPAVLCETEPAWLPDYALKESGPNWRTVAGAAAIALGLAKELSGETHFERARQQACAPRRRPKSICAGDGRKIRRRAALLLNGRQAGVPQGAPPGWWVA